MRSIIAVLITQLTIAPLWAQPTSAPTTQPALLEMPMGRSIQTSQGRLQGFTLDEFKLLLRINVDYRSWGKQIALYQVLTKELTDLSENQKLQIKLLEEQRNTLSAEVQRLTQKWSDENLKRLQCEAKPAIGSWLAWGTAGALATALTVLIAIVAYRN